MLKTFFTLGSSIAAVVLAAALVVISISLPLVVFLAAIKYVFWS